MRTTLTTGFKSKVIYQIVLFMLFALEPALAQQSPTVSLPTALPTRRTKDLPSEFVEEMLDFEIKSINPVRVQLLWALGQIPRSILNQDHHCLISAGAKGVVLDKVGMARRYLYSAAERKDLGKEPEVNDLSRVSDGFSAAKVVWRVDFQTGEFNRLRASCPLYFSRAFDLRTKDSLGQFRGGPIRLAGLVQLGGKAEDKSAHIRVMNSDITESGSIQTDDVLRAEAVREAQDPELNFALGPTANLPYPVSL